MSSKLVNLDALIPREDFRHQGLADQAVNNLTVLPLRDLDDGIILGMLRKPDFQRETASWSVDKVVNLIRSFVTGDLIPSVILWRSNQNIFVIDGAHRLSAMMAWIHNDYGDGPLTARLFPNGIPEEQRSIAAATRTEVDKKIRSWADHKAARTNIPETPFGAQVRRAAGEGLVIQWVSAADAKSAEASFLRINQALTPLDPTEKRLIKARESASAIASRAIARGGSGHKYWKDFDGRQRTEIESLSKEIHDALFLPPLNEPLKTTDVPIAGYGHASLPFVFDLVIFANDIKIKDSSHRGDAADKLEKDVDGTETEKFLRNTKHVIDLVTGTGARSLGLHPLVYFFSRGGYFLPGAFLGTLEFVRVLEGMHQLVVFSRVRNRFEEFLLRNKSLVSQLGHKLGSGKRVKGKVADLFILIFAELASGGSEGSVLEKIRKHDVFSSLINEKYKAEVLADDVLARDGPGAKFGRATKNAIFLASASENRTPCGICGAWLHRNSIQFDHKVPVRDGGRGISGNGRPVHPYCNSVREDVEAA